MEPHPQHEKPHSTFLARHKREGEAASWAGNSPNVIHYCKGLVKEADASELWTITPETVKGEIVALCTQAAT